jgi:hypothetical protein
MHLVLVRLPAPGAVHTNCDVGKRIEAEALKTFVSGARVSMALGSMPKVKDVGVEVTDLGTHRLVKGSCPGFVPISLPAVHVVAIAQFVETHIRCASQRAIAAAKNTSIEKAMTFQKLATPCPRKTRRTGAFPHVERMAKAGSRRQARGNRERGRWPRELHIDCVNLGRHPLRGEIVHMLKRLNQPESDRATS